ncbi:MAG TPA: DNA repair protein RecO [Chryseolinea sp.]|nr:DNA repair protein RecO [Chryseolinea sp.]
MLYKTHGVVFRFTKYGETSIIVNIFTALFGLQSYIVNGVRSKTSKNRIALFQPLTLLDLVVYHRENANINRIRELKCLYPYQTITSDIKKSAIAIFINEVLNKTVKEESHASDLCNFMIHSFITLDTITLGVENFHLIFLIKLSRWLGFGAFNANEVLGARMADQEIEKSLEQLLKCDYEQTIQMNNAQRRVLLDLIIKFYSDHIENIGELRSVQVLREVLA